VVRPVLDQLFGEQDDSEEIADDQA
jgi:hypothetical protein